MSEILIVWWITLKIMVGLAGIFLIILSFALFLMAVIERLERELER